MKIAVVMVTVVLMLGVTLLVPASARRSLFRKRAAKERSCRYEGQRYSSGASFVGPDGCDTCSCFDGTVTCVDTPCKCYYEGQTYDSGSTVPAHCASCTCVDGNVLCREEPCEPTTSTDCVHDGTTYADGDTIPTECGSCVCTSGIVQCDATCPPSDCVAPDGTTFQTGSFWEGEVNGDYMHCECTENGEPVCAIVDIAPPVY